MPLGVFDSGVGGLTVVRALRAAFPSRDILYVGDTARVPYGNKSAETVTMYSRRSFTFSRRKERIALWSLATRLQLWRWENCVIRLRFLCMG
jgi:glutamate racemase